MNTGMSTAPLDVMIVGAGFTGLYQLKKLRDLGLSVRLYEAGKQIGGIWYWNCYAGARVDTECHIYQYSDPDLWKEWNWSERYPSWHEMRRYFEYVDKKWQLTPDISFNKQISAMQFDERSNLWNIEMQDGEAVRARFVLLCTGFASAPYIPKIKGEAEYRGFATHTARWPQEGIDFHGLKVGVIGNGASGVQVIQEASQVADRVVVFQRTPMLALPMHQYSLTAADNETFKLDYPERFARRAQTFGGFDFDFIPESALDASEGRRERAYEEAWQKGGFHFWLGIFHDVLMNEEANATQYSFWRKKTLARIRKPGMAAKLAPAVAPHPFGTKRPSLEQNYYDVMNQDNVHLVDLHETPIVSYTGNGIKTTHEEFDLDVIVFATGFDAVTGGITSIDLHGTQGRTIGQKWSDGIKTQLGVATHEFPNLLFLYGPQSPSGFLNGPSSAELQGDLIIDLIKYVHEKGSTRIEADAQAEEAWAKQVHELVQHTLFPKAKSWYMGANIPGKKVEVLNYPGGLPMYLKLFRESAEKGYEGFILS